MTVEEIIRKAIAEVSALMNETTASDEFFEQLLVQQDLIQMRENWSEGGYASRAGRMSQALVSFTDEKLGDTLVEDECGACGRPQTECTCSDENCPGCGCAPGDGITESCNHPDGCGYFKSLRES